MPGPRTPHRKPVRWPRELHCTGWEAGADKGRLACRLRAPGVDSSSANQSANCAGGGQQGAFWASADSFRDTHFEPLGLCVFSASVFIDCRGFYIPFLQKTLKGRCGVGRLSRVQSKMKGRCRLEYSREVAETCRLPTLWVTLTPRASGQTGPGAAFMTLLRILSVPLFSCFYSLFCVVC